VTLLASRPTTAAIPPRRRSLERRTSQYIPQDAISLFQLANPIYEIFSLPFGWGRFGGDSLYFGIFQSADDNGGENFLDTAYDVAFNNLGCYVGDEGFLDDLRGGLSSSRYLLNRNFKGSRLAL